MLRRLLGGVSWGFPDGADQFAQRVALDGGVVDALGEQVVLEVLDLVVDGLGGVEVTVYEVVEQAG